MDRSAIESHSRESRIAANAKQVTFNGLDRPVLPSTPDFIKALDLDVALSPDVLLAWQMNGEELPFLSMARLRTGV